MKKLYFLPLLFAVISSCKKEATRWETEWSAPLINDTLSLVNLVNDSTLLESGGYYYLDLERIREYDINKLIKIPDTTITEEFTIAVLNLTLNPGFSFVNSSEIHELNIPDAQLKKVILEKGYIDVTVKNPISTNAIFNVSLPSAKLNNVPFSQQYVAPPGTNANPGIITTTIDLSGYTLDLSGPFGADYNQLVSQITVSTDTNGPTVTITNQDVTTVKAKFRGVKLAYGRGYFSKSIAEDVTFDMDEMNIYGSGLFDLPATTLSFELENGLKVSGEGKLNYLTSTNSSSNTISLNAAQIGSSFNIDPATGWWSNLTPSTKILAFDNSNSNLEAFLENLGYKFIVGYEVKLNPWGNVSGGWDEFFPQSKLRVKMKAQMPMNLGMDQLVLRDTFEVNLNSDPNKTRVKSGDLIVSTSNAFPFSADIKLLLLDENNNVLHTIISPEKIESSVYGSLDANSNLNVSKNTLVFKLTESAASDANIVKNIVVQSEFNSPNAVSGVNEQQPIPVGAFLAVKLKTNFITENVF